MKLWVRPLTCKSNRNENHFNITEVKTHYSLITFKIAHDFTTLKSFIKTRDAEYYTWRDICVTMESRRTASDPKSVYEPNNSEHCPLNAHVVFRVIFRPRREQTADVQTYWC